MKLARALPGISELLVMELLVSIGIIFAAIVVLLPAYRIATQKAKLAQITSAAGSEITDHMIRMALTGETTATEAPQATERYPAGLKIGDAIVKKRIVDGAIRYEGQLDKPFFLAFAPSVIAEGPIGNVIWLCGNQKAPPGWTQPARPGTDLPPELIPSVCRDSRK